MQIWPFKPLTDMIEILEWSTDIIQSRGKEQRIAMRSSPRRTFNFQHVLSDYQYSAARAMIRADQDGFLIPDWTQSVSIGAISSSSEATLPIALPINTGEMGILWESPSKFEAINLFVDSSGDVLSHVVNDYDNAIFMPLWASDAPSGLSVDRGAAGINKVSIAFESKESKDLSFSDYPQYRGHDVMTLCPIIGGGSFEETSGWTVARFDNGQNAAEFIRKTNVLTETFQMRWHRFSQSIDLIRWLHSRNGRQKVFWLSSRGKDFEPADNISGTSLLIYDLDGVANLGRSQVFDIDITGNDDVSYYRRVVSAAQGIPVSGRTTVLLTIDSPLTMIQSDISRISILRCSRFNSDRLELLHGVGVSTQVQCIEVLEP